SPFHGAVFAVVESVAKITAMGGDYSKARLTLQEYFEKLGKEPQKWGKPFSALLGAYYAQVSLGIPAIGGKDSMSGTFKDLNVPPTLVSFAVGIADVDKVVSTELKGTENKVVMIPLKRDSFDMPDFTELKKNYAFIKSLISEGKVLSSHSVREGGIAEAISKMCFGNMIGFEFENEINTEYLFEPLYGSIILELSNNCDLDNIFKGINYKVLGHTIEKKAIRVNGISLDLKVLLGSWQQPLEKIFPTCAGKEESAAKTFAYAEGTKKTSAVSVAKPRVFIPVFPGTNCEYDTASAFNRAGGIADVFVVRNLTAKAIEESIEQMVKRIDASQIIMIPGGFSGGDEPDGSGKFIATAFRNPYVKESVMRLLNERDGLILGICNGFQALIKLGLVPYGEIRDIKDESPTLTFNTIGRHVSCMVNTKVISTKSPWFNNVKPGDVHAIAVSHGEGRFVASPEVIKMLEENSQVATQYVDTDNNPTYDIRFNPNGSVHAIEGITSPDGRVLGKMGHSERIGTNIAKNVPGEKDQKIFEAGVGYFK
ncbi:MAG TPA: phosphoribosylformylglycinamidine synthase subunit PurQ, partial [Clostridia bacterium]